MAESPTSLLNARLSRRLEAAERELQIQAAIDRVLQSALRMQASEDVATVVEQTYDALVELGVGPVQIDINIVDKDRDLLQSWGVWEDAKSPRTSRFSLSALRKTGSQFAVPRRGRQKSSMLRLNKRQLTSEFGKIHRASLPGNPEWHATHLVGRLPSPSFAYSFYFSAGMIGAFYSRELTKPEITIACRIADAFDVAYRRFIELQQKEEQNRELIIQNALERVRSRALGMQQSTELDEVAVALFDAMADIGIPRVAAIITIGDEQADTWRMSVQLDGYDDLVSAVPPLSEVVAGGPATGGDTVEAWQRGDSHYVQQTSGDVANAVIDYWANAVKDVNPNFEPSPDWFDRDRFYMPFAYNRYGAIGMTRFDVAIRDDEIDVLKRFSQIFEFAYSRFLELQARELRAHEAQLEAASERVRAAAMQMRGSADLMDVVGTMHQSLHQLGVEPFSTSIHFVDDEDQAQFQHYLAVRNMEPFGFVLRGAGGVELEAPTKLVEGGWRVRWVRPVSEERLAVWRAGQITTKRTFMEPENYLQPGRAWYAPAPDKADLSAMYRGELDYTVVPFRYGVVTFTVPKVTEQHIATVQTLTEALSLGYMRFKDFQQLEQASINKSQFLRRMSHDLRSPMNAIIGYTRLLSRRLADRMDEREARNLANIETSSNNLLSLINDILDLSRIEAGRIEVNVRPVEVRRLADECADALASIVQQGVTLHRDLAEVGQIQTDADRLRQVIMNLLGNATKFTESGSITLSLRTDADAVELSVADTGIGIPADDLPHIFDEFRQVERQGGAGAEGTGLGLAIAKKTVELLGGEIHATSEVGAGTTFTVRLPA